MNTKAFVKSLPMIIGLAVLAACSGTPTTTSNTGGGNGSSETTYTIGGSVSGLTGTVVLQNNAANNLSITANGTFTFSTAVASGGAYKVTVLTQPTNQTCVVTNGTGTASANVTNVQVACTANGSTGGGSTFTIGGTVTGLSGTGMVLQDNGGNNLTVNNSGPFTFTTAVASGAAYSVTILTQPTNPSQVCTVSNGSSTATANVTNMVVACAAGTLSVGIGGSISGLEGSGMVLQNNGGNNLSITGNGPFTFSTLLASGSAYDVTILTQPSGPTQTCNVLSGTGTASVNIVNVQVICGQPSFSVNGTLIGLVNGTGDTVELQNNAGDDLFVTGNNKTFTFPTEETSGGIYDVSVFLQPTSQPQPCNVFNGSGVVTVNVSNVIVDCQHNDYTWVFGSNTSNQYAIANLPPPQVDTNTPGGRDYASTWTDNAGRKWLFGGFGYPLPTPSITTGPALLNDLWVWNGVWTPANLPVYTPSGSTTPVALTTPLEELDVNGYYGTLNTSSGGAPGSRWGAATWTDSSGNLWMFGGQGYDASSIEYVLLNDVWEFVPSGYDATGTFDGAWIWKGGSNTGNHQGTYTNPGAIPGARWGAAIYKDSTGNVWLFGGQGYDSAGNVGLLSDLWEYSGGTWTFVAGSQLANQNGSYGSIGNGSPSNVPGGRQTAVLWTDTTGNVWLFGGFGLDSVGTPNGTLNDLWKWNGTQWTWVSGSSTANQNGNYGTQLTSAATNVPGSRWGAVGWSDSAGDLWFFGGWGYDSTAANGTGFLNDTWEFQQSNQQWIWWKGSSDVDQNGQYLSTIPYTNNVVGGRRGAALWQPDTYDYILIFGGQGYDSTSDTGNGYLNDLWRYLPYP